MKIIHAADLHLDSPLRGLAHYEGAPTGEIRMATRRAFSALIDHCIEQKAAFLLIAGDLYDGDFRDYATALFFVEQVARLRECGTRVIWLRGNHDAANKMTRHLQVAEHVFELSVESPQTLTFEREGCAFHGQGYPLRDVQQDLSRNYPVPLAGMVNFGLLHTALDGRPGHALYAPCSLAALKSHGYDYWALGHVHQREVLSREPWVVFPGNLQGRHIRETGPKGCTEITIENGNIVSVRPVVLDQVRWELCEVDVSSAENLDDVLEQIDGRIDALRTSAEGRLLSTRVCLIGESHAHGSVNRSRERIENELRARTLDFGDVYLEDVRFNTQKARSAELIEARRDALGDLFRAFEAMHDDPEARAELWEEITRPMSGICSDLFRDEGLQRDEILEDATRLLESRLLYGGGSREV